MCFIFILLQAVNTIENLKDYLFDENKVLTVNNAVCDYVSYMDGMD